MMRIVAVPQLRDNYAYLVIGEAAVVIDPAEGDVVLAAAAREGARLTAVLNTHHHFDHTGGNEDLAQRIPGIQVFGSAGDASRIPRITGALGDRERIRLGDLECEALAIPCHTSGHVAYRFGDDLFTGDTLFAGGCGKFFEGTPGDMYHALHEVIGELPDSTRIWCGHEYTEKNLDFALTLEPNNRALVEKRKQAAARRAKGEPTVPTTLGEERSYNPFLRVSSPELLASLASKSPGVDPRNPVAVLGALRALKDRF